MNKITVLLVILCFSIIGCKNEPSKIFEVTVHIENLSELRPFNNSDQFKAFLYSIPTDSNIEPIQLDSVSFDEQTKTIVLKGITTQDGIYDIIIENGPIIPLINDVQQMTVRLDFKSDVFYSVEGSPLSKQLCDFLIQYAKYDMALENSFITLDSLKQYGASDAVQIAATENKNVKLASFIQYLDESINDSKHGTVAVFMLGRAARLFDQTKFEQALSKISQKFPEDIQVQQMKNSYFQFKEQNEAASQQINAAAGTWVGVKSPNLTMLDPNNKKLSISDFKGKWVLVDFWASWCYPCRIENPNLVKAYKTYKDKNFTILGVSLDQSRDNWLQAIEEDKLFWPQMSDLRFWNSEAVSVFKFQGIPYNILIDPDGNIVAEKLMGEKLIKTLSEYLDK